MKRRLMLPGMALLAALILALPALSETPRQAPRLPSKFDLRDYGGVTPVKQQAGGTCWTHGTMASIESHMLVSGFWRANGRDGTPAVSEYHLDWWNGFNRTVNEDVPDPTKETTGMTIHRGGDYRVAAAYLSRGDGVVLLPNGHTAYQDKDWYAKAPPRNDPSFQRYYVRDVEWYTIGDNLEGIELIKKRIMTDGALGTCYAAGKTNLTKDFVHYQPKSSPSNPNHSVAIVGWDDDKVTTDAEYKGTRAEKPGAWRIKNSWGDKKGEQGYYWISYYDKHCARHPEMGAVSFRNLEPMVYTDIYGHDYHGWRDTLPPVSQAFNTYTATSRQHLRAVSFYTARHDVQYRLKVYGSFEGGKLDNELAAQSGISAFTGFHTVNLDLPVLLQKGEKFYVAVELSAGGHAIDRTSQIPVLLGGEPNETEPDQPLPPRSTVGPWVLSKAGPGESYYHDGKEWKDLYEYKFADPKFDKTANFCIKALAVRVEEPKPKAVTEQPQTGK